MDGAIDVDISDARSCEMLFSALVTRAFNASWLDASDKPVLIAETSDCTDVMLLALVVTLPFSVEMLFYQPKETHDLLRKLYTRLHDL